MGTILEPTFVGIVYDISTMNNTNLQEQLHSPEVLFKPVQILRYAIDIVNALMFLIKSKINYLNLKSKNVIVQRVGETDKVSISDFGLHNTLLGMHNDHSDKILEPEWIAPEFLKDGEFRFIESAEVYSFGILFYEMVTRLYPYEGMNAMHIGLKVAMEGLRPDMPDYVPQPLKDLIYVCWYVSTILYTYTMYNIDRVLTF
jgi:serine/threonine protein kinase